jgi:dihydrofolate reductase
MDYGSPLGLDAAFAGELVVHPVVLGAGRPFFPALRDRIGLRLLETRPFAERSRSWV